MHACLLRTNETDWMETCRIPSRHSWLNTRNYDFLRHRVRLEPRHTALFFLSPSVRVVRPCVCRTNTTTLLLLLRIYEVTASDKDCEIKRESTTQESTTTTCKIFQLLMQPVRDDGTRPSLDSKVFQKGWKGGNERDEHQPPDSDFLGSEYMAI